MTDIPRTLFVAGPPRPSAWYRIALPAERLGADWVGVDAAAGFAQVSGAVGLSVPYEDWSSYDVIVVQQPHGDAWLQRIAELRAAGVTVLYETDDERRSIAGEEHRSGKELARLVEQAMRACDGVIFATDWLARQFRGVARSSAVCRNGIDLERFAVTRVERPAVHIGWGGDFASHVAMRGWLGAVRAVLLERPETRFLGIGADFSPALGGVDPARRMTIAGTAPECYPAVLSLCDIALAPTDGSRAFRAKSDLRFLEAAAVGAAVVGDPRLYDTIEDGVTGLHARTPTEVREALLALVDDAALRRRLGCAAQAYVREHRTVDVTAADWAAALRDLVPAGAAA
jgi:glycosyltransferase involved in cell wall biosynthesis